MGRSKAAKHELGVTVHGNGEAMTVRRVVISELPGGVIVADVETEEKFPKFDHGARRDGGGKLSPRDYDSIVAMAVARGGRGVATTEVRFHTGGRYLLTTQSVKGGARVVLVPRDAYEMACRSREIPENP